MNGGPGITLNRLPRVRWSRVVLVLPPVREVRKLAAEGNVAALIEEVIRVGDLEAPLRRAAAVTALGSLRATEAIGPLSDLLRSGEAATLRLCAADALRQIGGAEAVRELTSAIRDDHWQIREVAIGAIGESGDAALVPQLVLALEQESSTSLKMQAIEGLGKLPSSDAVTALSATVAGTSALLAMSATSTLEKVGTPESLAELARLGRIAPTRSRRWDARRVRRRTRRRQRRVT